ncbi:MAG: hypothetical protein ABI662_09470 [Dermatophilaceae bacterium]
MARLPETDASLTRYLRREKRQALRQTQTSSFSGSGMSVPGDGFTQVDGTLTVVGTLDVLGPMAVSGTLSLPAGIIDNDALSTPVMSQAIYALASNFALSTTLTAVCTSTVTVPAGFTTAAVNMTARTIAFNPNTTGGANGAGGDYYYTQPSIGGFDGIGMWLFVDGSGSSAIHIAPVSTILTGLTPGSTFDLIARTRSSFISWAADTQNAVVMTGLISWGR